MNSPHYFLRSSSGLLLLCAAIVQPYNAKAQNCAANAGGNTIVCSSSATLTGAVTGTLGSGPATWSFVSGPATPVIASPNALSTNVSGMTADGNYVFQLSQPCGTGTAVSQVTVTAHPRPASFTAGPDKTNICATTGNVTLDGVIPPGYTGSWSAVNIYSLQRFGTTVATNSSFSNATIANPIFALVNTTHDADPAYYAILTIQSADGGCSYKDTAVVRFCPNPALQVVDRASCITNGPTQFFDLAPGSPAFGTNRAGAAGAAANGTTITLNVTSQPPGGNIAFSALEERRVLVTGATAPGAYTFTITVSNCCGTVTTAPMTFTVNGITPNPVNFQPPGHGTPEQLVVYSTTNSGGEVHCGIAGTATPELFYFDIDPADPANTITTVSSAGVLPPGASTPVITVSGAGTAQRIASVDPGAGGWKIGTYRFNVTSGSGSCSRLQTYYIHISDNSRPPLFVADTIVCYPGAGAISADIALPAVYQGVVNSSYLQDFQGYYNFQVISKPAGAANPQFPTSNLRRINLTHVTIANLDKPGDYVIRIIPFSGNGAGPFLEQEYACSGVPAPLQHDFTLHLTPVINANAGSDVTLGCVTQTSLIGNATGSGTGLWTVAATPQGANPVFSAPSDPATNVSGMAASGSYAFAWTVTTNVGGCKSSDTILVTTNCVLPVGFMDFAAYKDGNAIGLQWTTASERNNRGFDVERSRDGAGWQTIGFVESLSPNSNQKLEYRFTDRNPLAGTNYYRLKQVDYDGKFAYSPARKVAMGNDGTITAYPNPAQNTITLSGLAGNETLNIYDAMGKKVLQQVAKSMTATFDITRLRGGVYRLQLIGEGGKSVYTTTIVKLR